MKNIIITLILLISVSSFSQETRLDFLWVLEDDKEESLEGQMNTDFALTYF